MEKRLMVFMVWLATTVAIAQPVPDTTAQREDDIVSLEDLMKAKVTVASKSEQTLRETPGVVTIITSKEIRNMGARDLIDVLRMVPGLDFAHDIDGVVGMGVRGNWAQEAKVMVMVDGVDMTENAYGSQQFSSHYPVDIIDRIEIIRGPGSAIYGGNASLAVINIITKDAAKTNGFGISTYYGQLQNTFGRANVTANIGKEFNNGLAVVASVVYGKANMSDRTAYLPNIGAVNYADSSRIGQLMTNLGIKYKGLNVRYIFDNYTLQSPLINNTYLFQSHLGSISYDIKLGNKVVLTPKFGFKNQLPWFYKNTRDTAAYNTNVRTSRYTGSAILNYKPVDKLEIIFGAEYFHDRGVIYSKQSDVVFNGNRNHVNYFNLAGYVQAQWFSKWVNITGGIRVDKHNRFGTVAVPRLVLTKVFKKFHAKLMYSRAFRTPMIFNMDLNKNINPEKTEVFEAELGYRISNSMIITTNLFYNNILSPIIYTSVNDVESYINGSSLGSYGIESEFRINQNWGYITANYSYYHSLHEDTNAYRVEGNKNITLAFPAHKISLNSNFKLGKKISLNMASVFYSQRYGYNSEGVLLQYKPTVLLSTFLQYENIVKGLSAGVGVYDILGQNYQFVQAYKSFYDAVPGPGREVVMRLRYKFSFN